MFQTFLRYELGCKISPSARILHTASKQKMYKKYGSACSSCIANVVRSSSGKCSSIAITTHVEIIVIKVAHSNGGHSMINLNSLRMGFFSPKMKSDDGPGGGSVPATDTLFGGTTFTFTFWPEFVVVAVICVSTLAPTDASCIAVL